MLLILTPIGSQPEREQKVPSFREAIISIVPLPSQSPRRHHPNASLIAHTQHVVRNRLQKIVGEERV
jgi:hypothetical protein